MAEDKQINEVAFLKSLNANRQAAKAASKEKRPDGVLSDVAILQKFGLTEDGATISLPGNVSKIQLGFAKKDTARPFFRFAYGITENSPTTGLGRGTVVSNYHELTVGEKNGEVYRTIEEAYAQLFYEFQGLGENTEAWAAGDPIAEALKQAKKHTKDKTPVMVTLSAYAKRNSDALGLNVRVDPLPSNEDLDNVEVEEETTEDTEGESEEYVADENWIGYKAHWEDESGPEAAVDVTLETYDADSETFTGTGDDGETYTDIPASQLTWIEDQDEE